MPAVSAMGNKEACVCVPWTVELEFRIPHPSPWGLDAPTGELSFQSRARNPPALPEAAQATSSLSTKVDATPRCAR